MLEQERTLLRCDGLFWLKWRFFGSQERLLREGLGSGARCSINLELDCPRRRFQGWVVLKKGESWGGIMNEGSVPSRSKMWFSLEVGEWDRWLF
jgi:hypothetical protein